jgi:hypothetical protein
LKSNVFNGVKVAARKVLQKQKQVTDLFHVLKLAEHLKSNPVKVGRQRNCNYNSRKIKTVYFETLTVIHPNHYSQEVVFCFTKSLNKWSRVKKEKRAMTIKIASNSKKRI